MTKELNKGFTGIEINGVQFSNIREMLIYMDKQRKRIAELEAQIEKMKCCFNCKHYTSFNNACMEYGYFLYECDMSKWEIKE